MGYFYFARHGKTVWNAENKICGSTDIALNEMGHLQAIELGKKILKQKLHIDEIICSPLQRALDTAKHVSEVTDIPFRIDERLREQCYGRFEAVARDSVAFMHAKQDFAQNFGGNGESMLRAAQRVYNLLDEIKAESDHKIYLLIAHNGISRIVESYFRNMSNPEFSTFGIENCEVRRYDFDLIMRDFWSFPNVDAFYKYAEECIVLSEIEEEALVKQMNEGDGGAKMRLTESRMHLVAEQLKKLGKDLQTTELVKKAIHVLEDAIADYETSNYPDGFDKYFYNQLNHYLADYLTQNAGGGAPHISISDVLSRV